MTAFTDLLKDLVADRESGPTEMAVLIESRTASHKLELEKFEVAKAMRTMEEGRRGEETRTSHRQELDDVNRRLDRVRELIDKQPSKDRMKEYRLEETMYASRKQQLHDILYSGQGTN